MQNLPIGDNRELLIRMSSKTCALPSDSVAGLLGGGEKWD